MTDELTKDRIKRLLARRSDIADALAECQVIDDVICKRVLKRPDKAPEASTLGGIKVIHHDYTPEGKELAAAGGDLFYLPRGKLESPSEYAKRIRMTPFFPKTPSIMNDRQGALFSDPPEVDVVGDEQPEDAKKGAEPAEKEMPPALEAFLKSATSQGDAFLSVLVKSSDQIQRWPLCAVFIDSAKLPPAIANRPKDADGNVEVSGQEKIDLNLGAPQLVVYSAKQILDYDYDSQGLVWFKTCEESMERADWDSKPVCVHTVRIFRRDIIESFKITTDENKEQILTTLPVIKHGKTLGGKPVVPISIAKAFTTGDEELGRPSLLGCADADIAATRVRSDLVWNLFVAGNPLLAKISNKSAEDEEIDRNVSRYIVLANSKGTQDAEDMKYIQLDVSGLEMLLVMLDRFEQQAEIQGGKDAPGAITEPTGNAQMSGVSRAWQFKTGQERVLFLLTRELEHCFERVLDIVCESLGIDPDTVAIRFNTQFDVKSPDAVVSSAKQLLEMVQESPIATIEIIMRALTATFDDIESIDAIRQELKAGIAKMKAHKDEMDKATLEGMKNPAEKPAFAGAENG